MEQFFEKLLKILKVALLQKQPYEYNFLQITGKEQNKQLKIENSIEYHFINSGNSLFVLNNKLILYPQWMGVQPTEIKLTMNKNEVDNSVYEYEFRDVPFGALVSGYHYFDNTVTNIPVTFEEFRENKPPFNLVQVIVKRVSRN